MAEPPVSKPSKPFDWKRMVLWVAMALIGLSYWNVVRCGFVYDDQWQVVRNPLIQQPALYKTALTSDVWAFKSSSLTNVSNYYRPVFTAWSIVNYAFFSLDPTGWHVANVLLHALATYLAMLVLLRLRVAPVVTAVVTWIFAAHPVHVESVTWIAGSPDLLMSAFLCYSLWVYLGMREAPTAKGWALALVAMFLAMGSKESSMLFCFAIFFGEWSLSAHEGKERPLARALRAAAPYLLVSILFFIVRYQVTHQPGVSMQNPLKVSTMLISLPQALAFYLRQVVAPYELSSAYPLRAIAAHEITLANFYAPMLVVLAALAAMVAAARKAPAMAFGAAMTLIVAPSMYFRAFHAEHMVRDRYLYFPLFGAFLVLVGWIAWRMKVKEDDAWSWSPLAIGGLAVSALFAFLSMRYNEVWVSDATLWKRGIETDPKGSFAMMNLAEGLRKQDPYAAIEYAQRAVALNSREARPTTILGMAYKEAGDFPNAERALKDAIKIGKDTVIATQQLADLYNKQGRFDEAVAVYEDEIRRNPGYKPLGRVNIAVMRNFDGKKDLAIAALESIRDDMGRIMTPDVQKGWYYLGQLYSEQGQSEKAKDAYRNFLANTKAVGSPEFVRLRDAVQQDLNAMGG